jgi:hypothetical protein
MTNDEIPTGPYPSRDAFVQAIREAASGWIKAKGLRPDPRHPWCLEFRKDWKYNIIRKDVACYIARERSCFSHLERMARSFC